MSASLSKASWPRGDDVGSGDVAGSYWTRLLGQDVGAEDRGHDQDEDPGGDAEPGRVAAREARDDRGAVDQHRAAVHAGSVGAAVVGGEVGPGQRGSRRGR